MATGINRDNSVVSMGIDKDKPVQDGPTEDKSMETLHVEVKRSIALVDTDSFAMGMGTVVVCNVICIGFETEFSDQPERAELFGAVNNGFLLCYIIELMMRLMTSGVKAFRDIFTVMDLILVFMAFLERIMASSSLARALPTFRLFRYVRVLRASRYLRHSRELRAICTASVRMMRSLSWVVFFLFFLYWILGTFAHLVIGHSAEWNETLDPSKTFDPFVPLDIQEYFGSVWKSFVTLLQVTTLSQWAPHIARPIVKVYPVTFLFFVIFLMITTYGILVAVVSNLVQDSMLASKANLKAIKDKQREDRKRIGVKARDILAEVDADGSGELDQEELEYALQVTNLEEILRDLGVPVVDAESLVRLLDYSGNGAVSYDELIEGAIKMDEDITKRDYAMMGFWVKNLLLRTSHLEERLAILCDKISLIRKRLGGSFASLRHMIQTAKDSQVRQRAIHILRTSGPALPPTLEKKTVSKVTLARMEPKYELEGFTRRLLGEAPRGKRAGSPGMGEDDGGYHGPVLAGQREIEQYPEFNSHQALMTSGGPRIAALGLDASHMPPAPPRFEVALRRAKRAEHKYEDRYQIGRNPDNPVSPNLRSLKSLL